MSDREAVSKSARNIYKQWMARGTGATGIKIKARKLDNRYDPETPPEEDDCAIHPDKSQKGPMHSSADPSINHLFSTTTGVSKLRALEKNGKIAIKKYLAKVTDLWTEEEVIDVLVDDANLWAEDRIF
jgi:hypothetical protein